MLSYFLVAAALEGVVPTEVVTAILQAMDCHPTSGKMLTQGCLALGNVARAGEPVHADMPLSPCMHATCMYTCPSPHACMQHACTHAPLPMHTCNMHVHMPLSPCTHATCMYTCPSPHACMQHACTHAPLPMHACNMHADMPLSPCTHATCMLTCPSPHAHMQHACTHAPLPMYTCNMHVHMPLSPCIHVHMPLSPCTHATCMYTCPSPHAHMQHACTINTP